MTKSVLLSLPVVGHIDPNLSRFGKSSTMRLRGVEWLKSGASEFAQFLSEHRVIESHLLISFGPAWILHIETLRLLSKHLRNQENRDTFVNRKCAMQILS